MQSILYHFSNEHLICDSLLCSCEENARQFKLGHLGEEFQKFVQEIELHFKKEEQKLFPVLVLASVDTMGPIQVMKEEHAGILRLLQDMKLSVEMKAMEDFLTLSDTLMVMMRQHNAKEENILYRIADNILNLEIKASLITG